jgi:putative SOS response-associated peptidase YedK
VCNLYSNVPSPDWLRGRFQVSSDRDFTGNLPPSYAIFPDGVAPVVRKDAAGERELRLMRWGIPGPVQFGSKPVTNVGREAAGLPSARSANLRDHPDREFSSMATSSIGRLTSARTPQAPPLRG